MRNGACLCWSVFCLSFLVISLVRDAAAQEGKPGDVNGDGSVDATDQTLLRDHLLERAPLSGPALSRADGNQDGRADLEDVAWVGSQQVVTITIPGLAAGARPLRMVRIPPGTFLMGNTGTPRDGNYTWELPRHEVTIGSGFYLGETEVTQAQWQAVMSTNPSSFGGRPNNPVDGANWLDCQVFIDAVNALPGMSGFRFPSEAEWEYACRGPESNPNRYELFSFGDDPGITNLNSCTMSTLFDQYMCWCGNAGSTTQPAASRLPNVFGLYDMHGNVWEWCQDWWHDNYNGAPNDGTAWETGGTTSRVYRGGAWYNFARACRTSFRSKSLPAHGYNYLGFRLARTP